ncbi:hypothetical protein ACJIZ3_009815 [Penstemon smallii]|uniref:Uncharacterized protein n=1 Tax=Penstemon smallii TaxID=265156 RepID=A0ABD3TDK4_9LAMI
MNIRGKICNSSFKDREEEELSFFRDIHKREKDQLAIASLLHEPAAHVSEEYFQANGTGKYGLYRMDSGGRKGGLGVEFLAETGKNDYNWLKTPPATPLFPSLEMETNSQQQLVIQREIPILQPLSISRFAGAGNKEAVKKPTSTKYRPKSPNPNQKLPQRHKTPTGRPSISSSIHKKNMNIAPTQLHDKPKQTSSPILKSNNIPRPNFLASNLEIKSSSNTNSKTRGVSPSLRQKVVAGFPDETPPPNLITVNRPSSATRGRPSNQIQSSSILLQKQEITNSKIIRRQSCSPSVTRGRKFDHTQSTTAVAVKVVGRGNQTVQVLGSRMVDKFMNARNSSIDLERQGKMKMKSSMNIYSSSTFDEERKRSW